MSSTNRISVWPLAVAFFVIGFLTWLFDIYYESLWAAAGWDILDNNSAMIYGGGIGIATAYTIFYITNKRAHRIDELLQKLENVKIEDTDGSTQSNETHFDWGKYVGYLSVPAVIAFVSGLGIGYSNQPIPMISIFLASISIGLAIAIFGIQQSQGSQIKTINKEIHNAMNDIKKRELRNKKYLEGEFVRSLVYVRTEARKTTEELQRMYNSASFDMTVADSIWNSLRNAAVERLEHLINSSVGIMNAKTLDKINSIIAEIKIDLVRDVSSAQVQTYGVVDLTEKLLSFEFDEARERVVSEIKTQYEENKKRWKEKGFSEQTTQSQRIFTENVIKQFEFD